MKVGIMNEPVVDFVLLGEYQLADGTKVTGVQHAEATADGRVPGRRAIRGDRIPLP